MTQKAPYKGRGAESEEKREPASDIDTAEVDSLKVLDPDWPIREADITTMRCEFGLVLATAAEPTLADSITRLLHGKQVPRS